MPTDAFCLTLGGFRGTGERMVAASGSEYWNEQKLREWLLLLRGLRSSMSRATDLPSFQLRMNSMRQGGGQGRPHSVSS
jgi:hypothetical protein